MCVRFGYVDFMFVDVVSDMLSNYWFLRLCCSFYCVIELVCIVFICEWLLVFGGGCFCFIDLLWGYVFFFVCVGLVCFCFFFMEIYYEYYV